MCVDVHLDSHVQAGVATPRQDSFEDGRGPAVCCLLAARAMSQLPLDLDLTDGKQHHLLRLRGHMLLVYEGCTPKQVRQIDASSLISSLQSSRPSLEYPFSAHMLGIEAIYFMLISSLCCCSPLCNA